MENFIASVVVALIGLSLLIALSVRAKAKRSHDPIEYYQSWGGYRHPIALQAKITKERAEALAARGSAYLIGNFDVRRQDQTHVVKTLRDAEFFDFAYEYYPNGKLKTATVTNAKGTVTVRRYEERGRVLKGNPSGLW